MNWTTKNILLIQPLLVVSVFLQLCLYGVYLLGFTVPEVFVFFCLLLLVGVVFTALINQVCAMIFLPARTMPAWLTVLLEKHCKTLGITKPDVNLSDTPGINAFALGNLTGSGTVILQQEIFSQLTQDEVDAVLAHELSHVAQRHSVVLTFLQGVCMLPLLPIVLLASILFSLIYDTGKFRMIFLTSYNLLTILIFPLASFLVAGITRIWEYHADRMAAGLVGREKYITALRCLHGSFFQHPNLLSISSESRANTTKEGWALSHPSLTQRINILRRDG